MYVNKVILFVSWLVACLLAYCVVSFLAPRKEKNQKKGEKRKRNNLSLTQPIRRTDQPLQLPYNLPLIPTRKHAHDTRHRPRIPGPIVRPAHSANDRAAHEIGVVIAQQERASCLVNGIGLVEVADERGREEGRDVGVVHYVSASVAVDFVGVDGGGGVVEGVGDDAVFCDGGGQGGG